MFGTIARMRIKKGMESSFDELNRKFEARHVNGWMGMSSTAPTPTEQGNPAGQLSAIRR